MRQGFEELGHIETSEYSLLVAHNDPIDGLLGPSAVPETNDLVGGRSHIGGSQFARVWADVVFHEDIVVAEGIDDTSGGGPDLF